jgi:hypothetical protein
MAAAAAAEQVGGRRSVSVVKFKPKLAWLSHLCAVDLDKQLSTLAGRTHQMGALIMHAML